MVNVESISFGIGKKRRFAITTSIQPSTSRPSQCSNRRIKSMIFRDNMSTDTINVYKKRKHRKTIKMKNII